MHIIYLDESGTQAEARHFVVAGLSFFERQLHYASEELDRLQRQYFPDANEPIELHASALQLAPTARALHSTLLAGSNGLSCLMRPTRP